MAFLKVENVAIRGISGCVPMNVEENKDLPFYASGEAEHVIQAIGIERRHVALSGMTASDLCVAAAKKLINELGWGTESIDLLAFCTQNPDYINHPTSFVAHDKLGLSENTMCIDYYHGCPGWVFSLCSISSMMSSGYIKRAILLDGDTVSKDQDASNREERPLFGDAGTATALEFDESAKPMFFNTGTKSEDGKALIHEHGGYRKPFTIETLKVDLARKAGTLDPDKVETKMDSMDVFSFAITKVPKAIKHLCQEFDIDIESIDKLVLHQANKMIVETIAKRLKVPMDKVPIGLRNYGNTTSASIPMAMITECKSELERDAKSIIACGFGTGLSWGAVKFNTSRIKVLDIIEI